MEKILTNVANNMEAAEAAGNGSNQFLIFLILLGALALAVLFGMFAYKRANMKKSNKDKEKKKTTKAATATAEKPAKAENDESAADDEGNVIIIPGPVLNVEAEEKAEDNESADPQIEGDASLEELLAKLSDNQDSYAAAGVVAQGAAKRKFTIPAEASLITGEGQFTFYRVDPGYPDAVLAKGSNSRRLDIVDLDAIEEIKTGSANYFARRMLNQDFFLVISGNRYELYGRPSFAAVSAAETYRRGDKTFSLQKGAEIRSAGQLLGTYVCMDGAKMLISSANGYIPLELSEIESINSGDLYIERIPERESLVVVDNNTNTLKVYNDAGRLIAC